MRSLLAVINVLGGLLAIFTVAYALPMVTALIYHEMAELQIFGLSAAATLVLGSAMFLVTRHFRAELKPRDGYLLVVLGWIIAISVAAVPYIVGEPHLSLTKAYFEAVAGLTTTGSTVINDLDHLPKSVNMWRCTLVWLGGMGIIVLAVAILPLLGVGGMQMYRAEMPAAVKDARLTPRITETAKAMWLIYAGLTAVCSLALWLAGMSPFDAICHSFSTMALAGLSTWNDNLSHFNSLAIELVVMFFLIVSAINFATHFVALRRGDPTAYKRDPEARGVVIWILFSIVLLTAVVYHAGIYDGFGATLRKVSFTTVSMITTTGYSIDDYSHWPLFAPMWMLFLGCVTCSTGSTGGGIKQFRALVLIKQCFREMFLLVHPQAVAPLKIGGQAVPDRVAYSVLAFISVYFLTIVVLVLSLLATNMDLLSALTAAIVNINNLGPGMGVIGPTSNYASLSNAQTWICSLAMFLGRIELFTFLVLFSRAFWRK
ncbi:MAG: potassium transporter [Nevskiaceae bacterium]|jgi:trk system potassium uptake protein TrkH|nr:potassium transporter [Nevskiaceae bacterium]